MRSAAPDRDAARQNEAQVPIGAGHWRSIDIDLGGSSFNEIDINFLAAAIAGNKGNRTRARDIAKRLLNTFGSVADCLTANENELTSVAGVDRRDASALKVVLSVITRSASTPLRRWSASEILPQVVALIQWTISRNYVEDVVVVCLDGRQLIKRAYSLPGHSTHQAIVTIPEILQLALSAGAVSLIIAHNHPRGSVDPSPEDMQMTAAIAKGCEAVGIALIDHIIVSGSIWRSLKQFGMI